MMTPVSPGYFGVTRHVDIPDLLQEMFGSSLTIKV